MAKKAPNDNQLLPLHVFRFQVDFIDHEKAARPLCSGAFAECSGLEATMEPKVISEGGRNYGAAQRVGPVTFATVILRRGMTSTRDLWQWFEMVSKQGKYAHRYSARVRMFHSSYPFDDSPEAEGEAADDAPEEEKQDAVWTWRLERALPIKFKAADLNAKGTDVGVEELHLAHEGISLETPPRD